jgi:hypothetical protein
MLLEVVARARRRLLWNALAFQLAVAVIAAFVVLALLLFMGTDLFGWHWVIILPAVSLSAGMWISHRRLPGAYPTAQLVDCRLNLSDALSTALFFACPHPPRRCDEGARQAQLARANRIAAGADIRAAVPITMPRIIYLAALPAVIAAGLFAWRYQYYEHLDLRAPMTNIVEALLKDVRSELAKLRDAVHQQKAPDPPDPTEGEKPGTPAEAAVASQSERANPSETRDSASTTSAKGSASRQQTEVADNTMAEDKGEGESQPGQQSPEDSRGNSQNDPSSNRQADGKRQQQGKGNQGESPSSANTSTLSNIKNSIANLLSALSPKPGGSGQQQQQQQMSKAQGGRSNGNNQKESAQGSNSEGGEPGEGSQQPGKGKSAGSVQTAGTPSEKQPGNGAGRDDGAKDIQTAQQLEAMGKLSVLLGKRSENLTGEFTAEATPGPQRLTTAYEQRGAQHTAVQATAERDDVSLASQEYVQKYFELVRKSGAPLRRPDRTVAGTNRRSRPAR